MHITIIDEYIQDRIHFTFENRVKIIILLKRSVLFSDKNTNLKATLHTIKIIAWQIRNSFLSRYD